MPPRESAVHESNLVGKMVEPAFLDFGTTLPLTSTKERDRVTNRALFQRNSREQPTRRQSTSFAHIVHQNPNAGRQSLPLLPRPKRRRHSAVLPSPYGRRKRAKEIQFKPRS